MLHTVRVLLHSNFSLLSDLECHVDVRGEAVGKCPNSLTARWWRLHGQFKLRGPLLYGFLCPPSVFLRSVVLDSTLCSVVENVQYIAGHVQGYCGTDCFAERRWCMSQRYAVCHRLTCVLCRGENCGGVRVCLFVCLFMCSTVILRFQGVSYVSKEARICEG
jgi:hypothetical protein